MEVNEIQSVIENTEKKFMMLGRMVQGVAHGALRALTVQGDRGLGKSHIVHKVLDEYDPTVPGNERMEEEKRRSIKRFTGKITPLQLFIAMQEYSARKSILLFDDCDSVWTESDSLNILKAATDTKERRIVTWASSTSRVNQQSFEFSGSIIVITNASSANAHYMAFASRCNRYRLHLTPHEKLLKIWQIAESSPEYDRAAARDVYQFILENQETLGHNLNLRTFVLTYNLRTFDEHWKELAVETVFNEVEA